ncbi:MULTISPECIES: HpcH/HpaI aldolase family protein [unclassified Pseudomonas]|uniref:HpcH/HpaI aldolase family protein n=1 Tax=unclassified Pseudomonas TaxID=196821 RepID=UPI0021C99114|nr:MULTISPECIES: aldolase/citrate lyase family protein [unclassified Pseudomonas]MCU1733391.1 aldolase/citrate lyase family protein [Pseudomonas sp. 20P_3.2_Bac4]MCU1743954.1 aldolase/citrate lyase family protein [Pseudomonas sp. 20P_3.2_Bac5]
MSAVTFATRLRAGEPLLSSFIKTPSHAVVEIAGDAGLDAVVLDAEHAPFDQGSLDLGLLACRAASVSGLVRVADARPATLLQALDLGADGLVLPHIIDAGQARQILQGTRYRDGTRGFSNSPRAGGYGRATLAEHLAAEDGRHAIVAQIEDREALDNLAAIASVEQIDCLLVGRADLAVSLGAERLDDPRVEAAVNRVLDAAARAGKASGIFVASLEDLDRFAARGVSFFILGSDQALLRAGWSQHARHFRDSAR